IRMRNSAVCAIYCRSSPIKRCPITSKRLCHKAQGCEERATLGNTGRNSSTSKRLWLGFVSGQLAQPLRGLKILGVGYPGLLGSNPGLWGTTPSELPEKLIGN